MQLIDFSLLDIQTVQYKQKILVCSLIYLILGKIFVKFRETVRLIQSERNCELISKKFIVFALRERIQQYFQQILNRVFQYKFDIAFAECAVHRNLFCAPSEFRFTSIATVRLRDVINASLSFLFVPNIQFQHDAIDSNAFPWHLRILLICIELIRLAGFNCLNFKIHNNILLYGSNQIHYA